MRWLGLRPRDLWIPALLMVPALVLAAYEAVPVVQSWWSWSAWLR